MEIPPIRRTIAYAAALLVLFAASCAGKQTTPLDALRDSSAARDIKVNDSGTQACRVVVVPMHGPVDGIYLNSDLVSRLLQSAKNSHPDVIVLEINGVGDDVAQIEEINTLLTEIEQTHRVITWIRSAFGRFAALPLWRQEVYCTSETQLYNDNLWRMAKGLRNDVSCNSWKQLVESESRAHHLDPLLRDALLDRAAPLSYNATDAIETGRVCLQSDNVGERDLQSPGDPLDLKSQDLIHLGLAEGIASDLETLLREIGCDQFMDCSSETAGVFDSWSRTVRNARVEVERIRSKLFSLRLSDINEIDFRKQELECAIALVQLSDALGDEVFYRMTGTTQANVNEWIEHMHSIDGQ